MLRSILVALDGSSSNMDNDGPSGTGQIAITPVKDLTTAVNFIVGPEVSGDKNPIRWVIDVTASYTGIKDWTFGFNFDYGWQANDVFLSSQGLGDKSAAWYGVAGYVAYDFLERFRAAVRGEWFRDADGVRTATTASGVDLFSVTATLQANIWKGLYARLEYRHDQATEKVFGFSSSTGVFKDRSQDTISLSAYYKFF